MSTSRQLQELQDHHKRHTTVDGHPARLYLADVTAVETDGTVTISPVFGRAGKARVPVVDHYAPTVGDRVVCGDLMGDRQMPFVLAPISQQAPGPILAGSQVGGDLSGTLPDHVTITRINGVTLPLTGEDWIAPGLLNAWAPAGSGLEAPGYLKDPFGWVHVRGRYNNGASGTTAFLLPPGYRPGGIITRPAARFNGSTPVAASVAIDTTGVVQIWYAAGTTDIGFGLSFLAEN